MATSVTTGIERFAFDYLAYPHQQRFHDSPLKFRLMGGASGPGKTIALIMDQMLACHKFPVEVAPQVHTIIFRRTYPNLEKTVITRFREKVPKELYKSFNESKGIVTWGNGSTTKFAAMQHEHDVWSQQGQWYKIAYDELTEFTFKQWQSISAWNRCPVARHCTKDGATNPIGVGARWVEDLFVKGRPCAEMDKNQKAEYDPHEYGYFPATYLDNPIYANDPAYIKNLDSYSSAISRALKFGEWGVSGGYMDGAWDAAENVYQADPFTGMPKGMKIEKWWRRGMGGDWGFEHNSAIYWWIMDDLGIVRVYRELVCNKHTPEELAERIVNNSKDADGSIEKNIEYFTFSHDAFAQRQDANPIAYRLGNIVQAAGLPFPTQATRDKRGREQILYDWCKARVRTGEIYNDVTRKTEPVYEAKLQFADTCREIIRVLPTAPRDEKRVEQMAEFLGDDPIAGAGYAIYPLLGDPADKPEEEKFRERIRKIEDPLARHIEQYREYNLQNKRAREAQKPARIVPRWTQIVRPQ